MSLAALTLGSREWIVPGAVGIGLFLVLVWYGYRGGATDRKTAVSCSLLKLLGVAALILCLLEPLWSRERPKPGANYFAIVADNSQGMEVTEPRATQSRGFMMRSILTDDASGWMAKLRETFRVRKYLFDSRLRSVRDFERLDFSGRSSSLHHALQRVNERYQGLPLAGILLLSDGNATDTPDGETNLDGVTPVYPVVIGQGGRIPDVSIQDVAVSLTVFEDAPVTIRAEVTVDGFPGVPITASLYPFSDATRRREHAAEQGRPSPRPISEMTKSVASSHGRLSYRFQIKPEAPGISFYALRVQPRKSGGKPPAGEAAPGVQEATLANNRRVVVVDRGGGPFRILYVSGRPNWEFKFLNRALHEDDQVQLVGLIRIARREPKMEFKGRRGETSNPLFRGFDKKDELTEQYDQPVLLRLNTRNAKELVGGFPKLAEELYGYTAIILDDLESQFFTRDQMSLVRQFVSQRGGGFLMLGGAESFREGDYNRTPIGAMLPVYLDRVAKAGAVDSVRLSLTREGFLEPWTRLRPTEGEEKERLAKMPKFRVINLVGDPKPGATVFAEAIDDATGNRYPALVSQRYGSGRTAVLTIGDLWKWHMHDQTGSGDMGKGWRQLIRWLIKDVPARTAAEVRPVSGDPNGAVRIEVRARNKEFWPLENADVKLRVTSYPSDLAGTNPPPPQSGATALNATNEVALTAEASIREPGLYEALYVPRATGAYAVQVDVIDSDGRTAGQVQTAWSSDPAAAEFKSLEPNRFLLETIAKRTGGKVIELDALKDFVSSLDAATMPVTEIQTFPLWHTPAMLLFALACLATEWGLRRRKGLA